MISNISLVGSVIGIVIGVWIFSGKKETETEKEIMGKLDSIVNEMLSSDKQYVKDIGYKLYKSNYTLKVIPGKQNYVINKKKMCISSIDMKLTQEEQMYIILFLLSSVATTTYGHTSEFFENFEVIRSFSSGIGIESSNKLLETFTSEGHVFFGF